MYFHTRISIEFYPNCVFILLARYVLTYSHTVYEYVHTTICHYTDMSRLGSPVCMYQGSPTHTGPGLTATSMVSLGTLIVSLLAPSSLPSKLLVSHVWKSPSSLCSESSMIVSGMSRSTFWNACKAAAFLAISVFIIPK